MANPKVWNKRDPNVPLGAIYVGRPTVYGNPFVIGRDGTREEVIEKYRLYVADVPHKDLWFERLRGKDLVCWCAPLPCHADILLEIANG